MEKFNLEKNIKINQKTLWENQHKSRERAQNIEDTPNDSIREIIHLIPENSNVYEVGAGNGRDARYLIKEKNALLLLQIFQKMQLNKWLKRQKKTVPLIT